MGAGICQDHIQNHRGEGGALTAEPPVHGPCAPPRPSLGLNSLRFAGCVLAGAARFPPLLGEGSVPKATSSLLQAQRQFPGTPSHAEVLLLQLRQPWRRRTPRTGTGTGTRSSAQGRKPRRLVAGARATHLSGQRFLSAEGCGTRSALSDPQRMQNPGFIFQFCKEVADLHSLLGTWETFPGLQAPCLGPCRTSPLSQRSKLLQINQRRSL